jgi:hypothetical protein
VPGGKPNATATSAGVSCSHATRRSTRGIPRGEKRGPRRAPGASDRRPPVRRPPAMGPRRAEPAGWADPSAGASGRAERSGRFRTATASDLPSWGRSPRVNATHEARPRLRGRLRPAVRPGEPGRRVPPDRARTPQTRTTHDCWASPRQSCRRSPGSTSHDHADTLSLATPLYCRFGAFPFPSKSSRRIPTKGSWGGSQLGEAGEGTARHLSTGPSPSVVRPMVIVGPDR